MRNDEILVKHGNDHLINKQAVFLEDSHQFGIPKDRINIQCMCCNERYKLSYEQITLYN